MKTQRDGLYAAGDIRQDSAPPSDHFRRRRRDGRDRGLSLHQRDFSLTRIFWILGGYRNNLDNILWNATLNFRLRTMYCV